MILKKKGQVFSIDLIFAVVIFLVAVSLFYFNFVYVPEQRIERRLQIDPEFLFQNIEDNTKIYEKKDIAFIDGFRIDETKLTNFAKIEYEDFIKEILLKNMITTGLDVDACLYFTNRSGFIVPINNGIAYVTGVGNSTNNYMIIEENLLENDNNKEDNDDINCGLESKFTKSEPYCYGNYEFTRLFSKPVLKKTKDYNEIILMNVLVCAREKDSTLFLPKSEEEEITPPIQPTCTIGNACTIEGCPGNYNSECKCIDVPDNCPKIPVCTPQTSCLVGTCPGKYDSNCNCIKDDINCPKTQPPATCTPSTNCFDGTCPGKYDNNCDCIKTDINCPTTPPEKTCTPKTSCLVGTCPGSYDNNCNCIKTDPKCPTAPPEKTCTPQTSCSIENCPGKYDNNCNCIKDDINCPKLPEEKEVFPPKENITCFKTNYGIEICGNNIDEDCDGIARTCPAGCSPKNSGIEICGNIIDEDCDGKDKECSVPGCMTRNSGIELCGNKIDEDCDGKDMECVPGCIPKNNAIEICGNNIDENCDGFDDACISIEYCATKECRLTSGVTYKQKTVWLGFLVLILIIVILIFLIFFVKKMFEKEE